MSGSASPAGRGDVLPGLRSFSGGAGFTCTPRTRRHPRRLLRVSAPPNAGRERLPGGCHSGRTLASGTAPLGGQTCARRPELEVECERPERGWGRIHKVVHIGGQRRTRDLPRPRQPALVSRFAGCPRRLPSCRGGEPYTSDISRVSVHHAPHRAPLPEMHHGPAPLWVRARGTKSRCRVSEMCRGVGEGQSSAEASRPMVSTRRSRSSMLENSRVILPLRLPTSIRTWVSRRLESRLVRSTTCGS